MVDDQRANGMTDAAADLPAGAEPAGGKSKNGRHSPTGPGALSSFNADPEITPYSGPRLSIEEAQRILADARRPLPDPPAHVPLRPEDMPFWDGLIRDLAHAERTPARLVIVAQTACAMADLQAEQVLLDREPTIIRGPRGTPMANPRLKIIEGLIGRIVRGIRQLGLHHEPRPPRRRKA